MMKSSINLAKTGRLLLALLLCLPFAAEAGTPRVVTTIAPLYALTAPVLEGVSTPELLMKPGDNPHHFSMKPQDARQLLQADLIICTSREMEYYLTPFLAAMPERHFTIIDAIAAPDMTLLDMRDGHEAAAHDPHHIDMHFWLSPPNAIAFTQHLAAQLAAIDPANAETYAANAAAQVDRLQALDEEIRQLLQVPAQGSAAGYASYHPSLAYFEQHYRINGGKAITRTPEAGASVEEATRLYRAIDAGTLPCLFREPEYSSRLLQQAQARYPDKTRVITLDTLGATYEADSGLYPAMMRDIAEKISGCILPAPME